jgi:hypothetical protein
MGDASEKAGDKPAAKEGWLPKLNLVLTMLLAALGFLLNFNAQQQKQAFDEQKLAIERLQSLLATNRDLREERGSREQMRLQLFDKVSVSLQKGEDRHVEAARALVESLLSTNDPVESELRVGLIRALSLGAPQAKQQELIEAANKEATFRTEQRALEAETQQQLERPSAAGSPLAAYRVDVFHCAGASAAANERRAQWAQKTLRAQVDGIRVRVRELAPSINASPGYGVTRSEVRFEQPSEARAAEELSRLLADNGNPLPLRPVNNQTPLYLSVFVC